jgi:hypothetical protein
MRARLVVLLLLFSSALHAACHCPEATTKEQEDRATQVFTGRVIEMATDKKTKKQSITFETEDTYKGDPPDTVTVTDEEVGKECALDLKLGTLYVVYTRWIWGDLYTSKCYGTQEAQDTAALGPADAAKEAMYPMLEKACMGHKAVGCCLDSVKAMAKGHFTPVPETGCPDGMIPDRLKCFTSYTWCIPNEETDRRHLQKDGTAKSGPPHPRTPQ